jgi:hypothetical protein
MPSVIAYPDRFYCRDVKQHILIAIVCSKWLNFKITEARSLRLPKLGFHFLDKPSDLFQRQRCHYVRDHRTGQVLGEFCDFQRGQHFLRLNQKLAIAKFKLGHQGPVPTIAKERIGRIPAHFPERMARGGLKGRHDRPFGFGL